ncbi:hypothetical protein TNCT_337981 [Trichonephila clavata]|uniref:Uncharacterized protein n=1 Tax=Trichonephila clavata TaxID=2740835 RepID=A0A8X6LIH0_TRICU|nr:hypothetical protein TNCT_337981 [Trichonephila clavata]
MSSIGTLLKITSSWVYLFYFAKEKNFHQTPQQNSPNPHHAPEPARAPNGSRPAHPIGNVAFLPLKISFSFPAIFQPSRHVIYSPIIFLPFSRHFSYTPSTRLPIGQAFHSQSSRSKARLAGTFAPRN